MPPHSSFSLGQETHPCWKGEGIYTSPLSPSRRRQEEEKEAGGRRRQARKEKQEGRKQARRRKEEEEEGMCALTLILCAF